MKKIPIISFMQNTKKLIMFAYNPKEIADLCNLKLQYYSSEYCRSYNDTKLREISNYLSLNIDNLKTFDDKESVNGVLPTCIVLNLKTPFKIIVENGVEYLIFPEDENEKEQYRGFIEVIDGRRRLMAFDSVFSGYEKEYNNLEYKMSFIAFYNLTLEEKTKIFLSINENQEKLDKNSVMQLNLRLGLLDREEIEVYEIIDNLNRSNLSPLQGKIVMSNEKISKGIKISHLSNILIKSKTYDCLRLVDKDIKIKILLNYLNAWRTVYHESYSQPNHILNKIAGIRYIFNLFTYFYKVAEYSKKSLTDINLSEIIDKFYKNNNGDKMFYDPEIVVLFRTEGTTISLAKKQGNRFVDSILNLLNDFDPTNI